jgi:hypothetical protein
MKRVARIVIAIILALSLAPIVALAEGKQNGTPEVRKDPTQSKQGMVDRSNAQKDEGATRGRERAGEVGKDASQMKAGDPSKQTDEEKSAAREQRKADKRAAKQAAKEKRKADRKAARDAKEKPGKKDGVKDGKASEKAMKGSDKEMDETPGDGEM